MWPLLAPGAYFDKTHLEINTLYSENPKIGYFTNSVDPDAALPKMDLFLGKKENVSFRVTLPPLTFWGLLKHLFGLLGYFGLFLDF